ncbi:branched-chain-amino-acid aminotransferase-like protein 2 isoform X2 [Acanthaster planci]|uniref:Branched-chain-amino-acid aminotransferase-like protein 2 isoform X2 n=1 Tax=Acanthaster planci TaxID=133434 RepID=A0A8B7YSI5_ACAPL|nr:branched-chain-amino-acid aminotransferase-like protein 2 isoform X2 [Acanthaster planci]
MCEMAEDLQRVFLWGAPRSMSTAFLKCLSFVDGIQIVNQPYASAHFVGPFAERSLPNPNDQISRKIVAEYDRVRNECERSDVRGIAPSVMTHQWIRDHLLEAPYPDKKVLLCRDQAQYLHGRYDILPQGFKYSFLIRHPCKLFLSLKKYLTATFGDFPDLRALPPLAVPSGYGIKELFDLVEYVRENIDPQPTIVDADDLLQDPAGILAAYCARMGMPYSSKLLSWEAGDDITSSWIMSREVSVSSSSQGFYKRAFESQRFEKPTPVPDLGSLPEDVRECAQFSMEYYQSLYSQRITPSTN